MTQLKMVDQNLWIADDKLTLEKGFLPFSVPKVLGRCSIRMTVIRTNSGKIFIHSPISLSKGLEREIADLGEVEYIIGPNVMHNTFLSDWRKCYPNAEIFVAPKASKRNFSLKLFPILDDGNPICPETFDQQLVAGHRNYETIFLHKQTRTLIATDMAYGINRRADILEKIWLYSAGVRMPMGVTSYCRNKIFDNAAFKASFQKVLAWEFDRVIMSHGEVLEKNAKRIFADLWSREMQ